MENFSTLLSKQMTRKEFLLYLAAVLVALTGINSLMKTIVNPTQRNLGSGFGYGPYGGRKVNK